MHEEIRLERRSFLVRVAPDDPAVRIDLSSFSQELRLEVGVDTLGAFDQSVATVWDGVTVNTGFERLTWQAESTLWTKRYHLDVHDGHLEFHAEVQGSGRIDRVRFFDSISARDHRPYSLRTRHIMDGGHTGARAYSTGSPVAFRRVFSPEPNHHGRKEYDPFEYGLITVNGDIDYSGGNMIANPGPLCFAVAARPDREWLAFGLAVEPGEHLFSDYEYLGGSDFALALTSWGHHSFTGGYRTPRVVMVCGATAEEAIAKYVDVLVDQSLVTRTRRDQHDWWSRPIVCGWGHQCYQADLFRVRSGPERPPDNAAYTLCTQVNYRDLLSRLDAHDLPWGTVIVDARWFLSGGLKDVDVGRWPDLLGFIGEQHRKGKRVVLWWGPWDAEGVPAAECVTHLPGDPATPPNRPGRRVKTPRANLPFTALAPGDKLAVDISLDSVRDRIRNQIRTLLGPRGLNADGLKIDHMSSVPGSYGMTFPEGSSGIFGIEAARAYLEFLYSTAKDVKPDALLNGQSPNPYLSDVQDMVRISPWTSSTESVAAEAGHSAAMARIADPGWLIDTNGYPMPSLAAFREYVDLQPKLGVPSLLYATHLDTTGEAFTGEDYARIRHAWIRR